MSTLPDPSSVKVYTVNGAASGSSSSLPDWLTRKRAVNAKGKKRAVREQVEGTIELIQHFEFPEASNRVKTTRDGHHAIATGTYKPQIRVWDLDQLSLKFERHSDAENVDFIVTYHFPSCDALFGASGPEVYRLNLEQGRYLAPFVVGNGADILGVNCIDINPAHQLFAFGVDGDGVVELWDPRSRTRVSVLRLPQEKLLPTGGFNTLPGVDETPSISVTAISSRADGLSYAVGTSTGHTLLYDIRSARPFATKDQGYGLPVKNLAWIEGGSRMAGDGLVLSADKKVIKIWDRHSPATNFTSITPAADINDVHHVPGSGLLLLANEGIQMTTFYIPQLGPAPRWSSFLENLTEEMEDQTSRTAYQDFKFIDRRELTSLGLDHLVGTPALKPYMHGYFISLQLYDTARVIAKPEKMEKMAETRIRTKKGAVKVNKALAEKVRRDEEKERKKEERKRKAKALAQAKGGDAMDVDGDADMEDHEEDDDEEEEEKPGATSLLVDPRFAALFQNPEFEVDEETREYALLHPSAAAHRQNASGASGSKGRTKTAVEEEEEESDKLSSDGLSRNGGGSDSAGEQSESEDSDDAGGTSLPFIYIFPPILIHVPFFL
ncbi:hypothetical protein EUX98_g5745 [Antrodiella citrinella]|uniref:Uncharacterized protein n=1 Tax=Antrodiella citrinella TaxID=2447956 RepID=A0A4S4MQQ6_9APHY|nr:hypothetical protein EUX98_g5745 [Antrodiella citrinella]